MLTLKLRRSVVALAAFAATLGASAIHAQEFVPLPPPDEAFGGLGQSLSQYASSEGGSSGFAAPDPLVCANPPKLADLQRLVFNSTTMSASAATELGFNGGSLTTGGNAAVLVQDWARTATCTANDGKTTVVYGQSIRVFASANDISAEGGLTLPIIAAHATLNRKSTSVNGEVIGFNDAALLAKVAELFGPLDVTNFSKVNTLVQDLASKAPTLTGGRVVRLGVQTPHAEISDLVLTAYALQQIADGQSCASTKASYPGLEAPQTLALERAYKELDLACDGKTPDRVSRARAEAALLGMRVKKR